MWILRRKGGKTAKRLARLICCRTSYKYLPKRRDFIINYGSDYSKANLNANVCFDKLAVQKVLEENEVRVPKLFLKGEEIPEECYPLLARKKFHSKGRDIIFIPNREELLKLKSWQYDFLVQYIEKTGEYRVHILGDYTTIVSVKVNSEEDANFKIRNTVLEDLQNCADHRKRQADYLCYLRPWY